MLHRFELHDAWDRLAAWADVDSSSVALKRPRPRGTDAKLYPALRVSPTNGRREFVWMREGLIPSYACDDLHSATRLEAHAEAITQDCCFRSAFLRRRCLIPANVLNECRNLAEGIEQPCSFAMESGEVFGIAGVWEAWADDEGHLVESFAIVTAVVTPVLRTLFDRMPVVIAAAADMERWLHVSKEHDDVLADLLRPLSPAQLHDWKMMPGPVDMHLDLASSADTAIHTLHER